MTVERSSCDRALVSCGQSLVTGLVAMLAATPDNSLII